MLTKEFDGIAGFAAAKAFEGPPGGVDYKAGSFFVVERATSGIVDPLFLQGDEITQDINAAMEVAVKRDPANWFWVHNRWKGRRGPQTETALAAAAAPAV